MDVSIFIVCILIISLIFGYFFNFFIVDIKLLFPVILSFIFLSLIFLRNQKGDFPLFLIILLLSGFVLPYNNLHLITLLCFFLLVMRLPTLQVIGSFPQILNLLLAGFIFSGLLSVIFMIINNQIVGETKLMGLYAYANLLLSIFMFYYTVYVVDNMRKLKYILYVISGVILINFILLVTSLYMPNIFNKLPAFFKWSIFGGNPPREVLERRFWGTFKDYELFAEYLLITLFLILSFLNLKEKKVAHNILYLMIPVILFEYIWTKTRGPLISLLVGSFFLLPFILRMKLKVIFRFILIIAITVIGGINFMPEYFHQYSKILVKTEFIGFVPDTRVMVWNAVKEYLDHNEMIFFVGQGGAAMRFGNFPSTSPHSLYLDILLRYGILALIFLVLFLVYLLIKNQKIARDLVRRRSNYVVFFVLLNLSFVFLIVDEIKIECTRSPNYEVFFWIYLGLVFSFGKVVAYEERTINSIK